MPRAEPKRVILLGALSAIGEATARLYAGEGASLVLAARNAERLGQVAGDLAARGAARCLTWHVDFAAGADAQAEIDRMAASLDGPVDVAMIFFGALGEQRLIEKDIAQARRLIDLNFSSAAEWCLAAANLLERQKRGTLLAVSSVAGDRGRQSNYVYGAAKAGLTTLVEGIAHRLAPSGARAVAVKLGFVDTPMTAHIEKGGPLWARPEQVARRLKVLAARSRKPVVYVPAFWRWIMLVVRHVPTGIYHRTRL